MEKPILSTLAARKKTLLAFLFIINYTLLITDCFAQPSITWQRTYPSSLFFDEGFNSVCKADGNNFYLGGYAELLQGSGSFIVKINPQGDTIWTKTGPRELGGVYKMIPTYDGGCVYSGGNDTAFSAKINSSGDFIWYKTYPITGFQPVDVSDMIKTSDGGYAMCGRVSVQLACVYKLDSLGNLQWSKIYSAPFFKEFTKIFQVPGGFFISGFQYNSGNESHGFLFKLNSTGDSVWQKEFNLLETVFEPNKIINISDRYFFFGAVYHTVQNKVITGFFKIDSNGSILDSVIINSTFPKNDYLKDVIKINNNRFLLCSRRVLENDTTFAVGKIIDSSGNILHYLGKQGFESSDFISGTIVENGDIIMVGTASKFSQNDFDAYAVRADSNLNTQPIGIKLISNNITYSYKLYQNYPNPFNPVTNIRFYLVKQETVVIRIYDIGGKLIRTLVKKKYNKGEHEVKFEGNNLPSGVYFYQLNADKYTQTKKMILIK